MADLELELDEIESTDSVKDEYDDTLEDLGGVCLFDPTGTRIELIYPWVRQAQHVDWETLADRYYWLETKPIYVRVIDPGNPRFGSISKVRPAYSGKRRTGVYPNTQAQALTRAQRLFSYMKWDNSYRNHRLRIPQDRVEFLENYTGPTVYKYDRSRSKRKEPARVFDRLDREINVGDFCAYILYQFERGTGASICFGTVTNIDYLGQVWCKNIPLHEKMASEEKKVKDPKLITVMTEDLQDILFVKKLTF